MPFAFHCRSCGRTSQVPDDAAVGGLVCCPRCGRDVPAGAPAPADEDGRPRPRRGAGGTGRDDSLAGVLAAFAGVVWLLMLPALVVVGLLFWATLKTANGAVQEAAAGAVYGCITIGLYVGARAVEKAAASAAKWRRR